MDETPLELAPELNGKAEQPAQLPIMVSIPIEELTLLRSCAQCMVEAGIRMQNPPLVLTPTGKQEHQKSINALIQQAGSISFEWGFLIGMLMTVPNEPKIVT